jgi:AraC-like DNA-binding protein
VRAVDKLARGQSITQTALELGYRSARSSTTLFTQLLGAPPRRYMQQLHQRDQAAA